MFRRLKKYLTTLLLLPLYIYRIHRILERVQRSIHQLSALSSNLPELTTSYTQATRKRSAIMTVFILKENILFLEEWIEHHLSLGVDHIVLYDNSKTQKSHDWEVYPPGFEFEGNKVNRQGIDYASIVSPRMSDEQIKDEFSRITEQYAGKLTVIEWARRNEDGVICYFQEEAIKDFIYRYRTVYDYGITIDIDEFLISDCGILVPDLITHMEVRNISSGRISQRRFLYRFSSLDTKVREIPFCLKEDLEVPETSACKTIFRMSLFHAFDEPLVVHYVSTILRNADLDPKVMRLHHYHWPAFRGKESLKSLNDEERLYLHERFAEDRSAFKYVTNRFNT